MFEVNGISGMPGNAEILRVTIKHVMRGMRGMPQMRGMLGVPGIRRMPGKHAMS